MNESSDDRESGERPVEEDSGDASTPLLPPTAPPETESSLETSRKRWVALLLSPLTDDKGDWKSVCVGMMGIFVLGAGLGLLLPVNHDLPRQRFYYYPTLSNCIGYIYFMSWSISFYPQILANFRRRTTRGLSPDFCSLNVLGFACYSAYTVALYTSPTIQELYRQRYGPDAQITVQSNDVAFALHAAVLSSLTLGQMAYYDGIFRRHNNADEEETSQRPSPTIRKVILGILLVIATFPVIVWSGIGGRRSFNWLDYLYVLSYVKIFISVIKYIPQVVLNYQRKSTTGWSIWQILLDFNGGAWSDIQLVLDCWAQNDYTGITGNLPKLCLGSVSIVFDFIFMTQHYILYRPTVSQTANEDSLATDEVNSLPVVESESASQAETNTEIDGV